MVFISAETPWSAFSVGNVPFELRVFSQTSKTGLLRNTTSVSSELEPRGRCVPQERDRAQWEGADSAFCQASS